ncbi:hypothetical protein [Sporosarcina sp. HYO08]|uniref:hypothetical protein n=1 Tax=Sporosarcina sp. HYO08 TaxID=1759557 RepID=UPI00079BB549|nr:hypothetical protein [Sporosarcina sp. HYO08]KXH81837.1 hypothetical protein AU377_06115 [Sporosarcina sp. HYO08]
MSPIELLVMMIFGSILILILTIMWFIFRKKKKIAFTVTVISVLAFVLFFALRPYYIKHQHAERYVIVADYLHEQYPEYSFEISPKVLKKGDYPYQYRVEANGYKFRNEIFRVDQDGSVRFTSFTTLDLGNENELDELLVVWSYEQPFEYLERHVELEEIARHEENAFLVRLMRVDGEVMLYNYLKYDGKYFFAQANRLDEHHTIEMNVSPRHDENYYVLATLPGFNEEHWKKINGTAAKIEFTGESPSIYVVPK